jgi:hypothetical protein
VEPSGVRQANPPTVTPATAKDASTAAARPARKTAPAQARPPAQAPPTIPAYGPRPASLREDLVTAVLGACLIAGILADAWAHVHLPDTLEGFFTPWHGLLYAGYVGTAAWTFWLAYQRRDEAPRWWRDGWPAGYRVGALGALVFAAGGLGDMIWHEVLGVEVALNAAFSPSHQVIVIGAVLLLSSPLRSWWTTAPAEGRWRAVAGVGSLALATTATVPLLNHSIALSTVGPTVLYDPESPRGAPFFQAIATVDGYLLTTTVLTVPLLLVLRRRRTAGTATALVGTVGLFVTVMFGFRQPQTTAVAAALATAALVDVLLARLDARRGVDAPLRLPIAGALFGALVWTAHLAGLQVADALRWPVEMWTGTVVLTGCLGAVLGMLAARPATRLP